MHFFQKIPRSDLFQSQFYYIVLVKILSNAEQLTPMSKHKSGGKKLAWQKGVLKILKVGPFTISILRKKIFVLLEWYGMMSDFDNSKWVFSRIIFFHDRLLLHDTLQK